MYSKFLLLLTVSAYIFPTSSVQAQTFNQCETTLNQVVEKAYNYGTSVNVSVSDQVNRGRVGNPTSRDTSVMLILGEMQYASSGSYYISMANNNKKNNQIAANILNSSQLSNNWANELVRDCSNVAEVSFAMAHTDWINDYAIQSNLTTRKRECLQMGMGSGSNNLSWNYQYCG